MKVVDNWNKATEQLAEAFTKKYFEHERYGKDTYWVGDEVGDVFCVADFFFNVDRMREALKLGATADQVVDYYYAELDCAAENKKPSINFKTFVKLTNSGELIKKVDL